jgi:hypothetical protein
MQDFKKFADSSDLILTYISIPGYHQQQTQKQQQEQINAATSRFHPYSLNTNQTSIPSSPFSDFATVSSDQKSKGSSGHGTSLASSSLGSSNSSTSISQHPPLACSTITRSRSRLPPGLHSGQFDEKSISESSNLFSVLSKLFTLAVDQKMCDKNARALYLNCFYL